MSDATPLNDDNSALARLFGARPAAPANPPPSAEPPTPPEPTRDFADLDMEDVFRITKEVSLGRDPASPDTEEQAAFRRHVQAEADQMRARGQVMDVPHDWAE